MSLENDSAGSSAEIRLPQNRAAKKGLGLILIASITLSGCFDNIAKSVSASYGKNPCPSGWRHEVEPNKARLIITNEPVDDDIDKCVNVETGIVQYIPDPDTPDTP